MSPLGNGACLNRQFSNYVISIIFSEKSQAIRPTTQCSVKPSFTRGHGQSCFVLYSWEMFVPDFELSSASALVSSSSVWLLLAAAIGLAIILAASGLDKSFFFFPSASSALCHRHAHKHISFVQNPVASITSL